MHYPMYNTVPNTGKPDFMMKEKPVFWYEKYNQYIN